jgi:hypothetical protein
MRGRLDDTAGADGDVAALRAWLDIRFGRDFEKSSAELAVYAAEAQASANGRLPWKEVAARRLAADWVAGARADRA